MQNRNIVKAVKAEKVKEAWKGLKKEQNEKIVDKKLLFWESVKVIKNAILLSILWHKYALSARAITIYSGDLNSEHLSSGNIWKSKFHLFIIEMVWFKTSFHHTMAHHATLNIVHLSTLHFSTILCAQEGNSNLKITRNNRGKIGMNTFSCIKIDWLGLFKPYFRPF